MEEPLEKAINENVEQTKEMMLQLKLAQTQEQYEELADIIHHLIAEYKDLKAQVEKFNREKTEFQHWLEEQKAKYE